MQVTGASPRVQLGPPCLRSKQKKRVRCMHVSTKCILEKWLKIGNESEDLLVPNSWLPPPMYFYTQGVINQNNEYLQYAVDSSPSVLPCVESELNNCISL